jgi:predicted N-formylglutamate amidohydrolase
MVRIGIVGERLTAISLDSSIGLLGADDPAPVRVQNPGAGGPFVLVCDHAGRATPSALGRLGLPAAAFDQHIAWDIGALNVAERLADILDSTLIHQAYSRLVIDCNRAPDHPGAILAVSDGWVVPGNAALSASEVEARVAAIHTPYHRAIAAELDARAAAGRETLLICVHSFTPRMGGRARPWHVGVLHGPASPACATLLELLRREDGLVVGDNEPYAMDGTDYTAPLHAWARGADVVEIEVRQDLIADYAGARAMAELFGRLLPLVLRAKQDFP